MRRVRAVGDGGEHGTLETFRLFCTMAACALALGTREEEYLEAIRGRELLELEELRAAFHLLVGEMEERPGAAGDLLGPAYETLTSPADRNGRGEFYTPPDVSELTARLLIGDGPTGIALDDWPNDRPAEVLELTCGSGGLVLALVGEMAARGMPPARVRVEAWDLAKTVCDMAYVNLTLYGVPARIVWGNTLSQEVIRVWHTPFWGTALGSADAGMRDGRMASGQTDKKTDEREAS